MKSGFKIIWTDRARLELAQTLDYLENKWTEKEMKALAQSVENTVLLMQSNPLLFSRTNRKDVYRAIVMRKNSMIFLFNQSEKEVIILSFFNHLRKPIL